MKILIATDSFKGTATAQEISAAIQVGWLKVRPADNVRLHPMADGGEGSADVLHGAQPGWTTVPVDEGDASAVILTSSNGTAFIELAKFCGFDPDYSTPPMSASTRKLGTAIRWALEHSAQEIIIALGGSATSDGGAGILSELGVRFTDRYGHDIPDGAAGILVVAHLDATNMQSLPPRGVTLLCDVSAPLTGARGAALSYGRQKGLTPQQVQDLDSAFHHYATLLGLDPTLAGLGAAGGSAAGLFFWGAAITGGAHEIARLTGLRERIGWADLVITGEGEFDNQSGEGKVVGVVSQRAAAQHTKVALIAGRISTATDTFAESVSLERLAGGLEESMADPLSWAQRAGHALALRVTESFETLN